MATAAQKAAALGTDLSITFKGRQYTIPASENWDIDVLEEVEAGHVALGLKALLGPDQWAAFRQANKKVGDLNAFYTAVGSAARAGNF